MTLVPRFQYGDIQGVITADFPLSRGTTPSVCTITVPNVYTLVKGITLPMHWSDGHRSMTFKNCYVSDVTPSIGNDGQQTLTISIQDQRWRWGLYHMSGRYNVRSGIYILPGSMKRPRELAALIFEELGIKDFDVRLMPNDTFPEISWDLTPANAALDDLCQQVNCHVTLSHEDRVVIYPDGYGKDLPAVPSSAESKTFDIGIIPGRLMVVSAPVKFQFDFPIKPVGLDLDNKVKPIDELSYTPIDGWKAVDPTFIGVSVDGKPHNSTNKQEYFTAKKLAQMCIYKWWQIEIPEGLDAKEPKLPIFNLPITSPAQFFPLLNSQIEHFELTAEEATKKNDNQFDKTMFNRLAPMIFGKFDADNGYITTNDPYDQLNKSKQSLQFVKFSVYEGGVQVDNDRMLVITSDPITFKFGAPGEPAVLYLRIACNFHEHNTRAPFRLEVHKEMPGSPDKKSKTVVVREDVIPEVIYKWRKEPTTSPTSKKDKLNGVQQTDNLEEVRKQLQYYLGFEVKKYQPKTPSSITTPVLFPFSPDGQIAQVNFRIEGSGFIGTGIFRQREEVSNLVTYDERRRELNRIATMDALARQYRQTNANKAN